MDVGWYSRTIILEVVMFDGLIVSHLLDLNAFGQ